jgi:hypothetical protein
MGTAALYASAPISKTNKTATTQINEDIMAPRLSCKRCTSRPRLLP